MNKAQETKIETNIRYSNSWWTSTSRISSFFSYTEKFHAYMALFLDGFRDHRSAPRAVCDIGFGSGFLLNKLINKGGPESFFIGLDISMNNVEIFNARRKKGPLRNSLALPLSPFNSQLPFRDSTINTLFCNHVLEHVPNDSELIDEIRRVLSQDGLAIIMIPINEERLNVPTHLRKYTTQTFQEVIDCRFSILYFEKNDVFSHWIRWLALIAFPFHNLLKRSLIFILSFIPFGLLTVLDKCFISLGGKPSEVCMILKKIPS
jgi:ubiquinone/menaquinone biosynthesis C-methylase UbiE